MSFDQPTDWASVTAEEWALGYATVARMKGVSRSAAQAAHARILAGKGTPGVHGRAPKPVPADFDPAAPTAAEMARFSVSRPTVLRWRTITNARPAPAP